MRDMLLILRSIMGTAEFRTSINLLSFSKFFTRQACYKYESSLVDHALTRACSGWPQHSGNDSKIFTTADAQAVKKIGYFCPHKLLLCHKNIIEVKNFFKPRSRSSRFATDPLPEQQELEPCRVFGRTEVRRASVYRVFASEVESPAKTAFL
jgi:hypothetical protein